MTRKNRKEKERKRCQEPFLHSSAHIPAVITVPDTFSVRHLRGVQRLADETGVKIVVHGSRQTGISVHGGTPFRLNSDLDLGVVGSADDLLKTFDRATDIANVSHGPMRIFDTIEAALENGFLVISPRD